jgi:hypothetical protein
MTHRTVVNCETGVVTQVEYTAEEQTVHDAAIAAQAAQALAESLALAEAQALAEQQQTNQETPSV